MISKKNFIKYIDDLKQLDYIYEEINKSAKKLQMFEIYNVEYENLILDILEDAFDDDKNHWIGYYVYELNYGELWEVNMVTDGGVDVPLKNASDLYDLLIKNMEDKNESNRNC